MRVEILGLNFQWQFQSAPIYSAILEFYRRNPVRLSITGNSLQYCDTVDTVDITDINIIVAARQRCEQRVVIGRDDLIGYFGELNVRNSAL